MIFLKVRRQSVPRKLVVSRRRRRWRGLLRHAVDSLLMSPTFWNRVEKRQLPGAALTVRHGCGAVKAVHRARGCSGYAVFALAEEHASSTAHRSHGRGGGTCSWTAVPQPRPYPSCATCQESIPVHPHCIFAECKDQEDDDASRQPHEAVIGDLTVRRCSDHGTPVVCGRMVDLLPAEWAESLGDGGVDEINV